MRFSKTSDGKLHCRTTRCGKGRWLRGLLLLLGGCASCGPIQSRTVVVDATAELARAATARASEHAPFEYVAAEEYLHQAREEESRAEFELAVRFAKKARDCARVARRKAEDTRRADLGSSSAPDPRARRCSPGPAVVRRLGPAKAESVPEAVGETAPETAGETVREAPAPVEVDPNEPKDPAEKKAPR